MLSLCPSGSKPERRLGVHLHSTSAAAGAQAQFWARCVHDARAQFSSKPKTKGDL